MHATRRLDDTLRHIKTLLRRDGWLVLAELTKVQAFTTLTFGLLDGWWRFADASVRMSGSPLASVERWRALLDRAGFRGFHRFVPTLLRMAGCRVLELPVGHRARRFGVSHYGIRNRAFVAFEDLLAVRWMQDRRLRYDATEEL